MKYIRKKDEIYFYFYDDFDYMKIQSIRAEMIEILKNVKVKKVYFDFSNVNFVDSTGIGFILARYREFLKTKMELIICNLSKENKIIFEMSGIFRIIRYQENGV